MSKRVDCLIIGGGPAGLTAAIYAARFRLSVVVMDAAASRAALIPCTRNHAGFPGGVSGAELLERMRTQALSFGVDLRTGRVITLRALEDGGFSAEGELEAITARGAILATGVTNRRPAMDGAVHDAALAAGRLRYCPVCDAYEVIDQKVAVIGTGAHGVKEASFLRAYTPQVTLIAPEGHHKFEPEDRARLDELGIRCLDGPAHAFELRPDGISLDHAEGHERFDTLYPALGSIIHSDLAHGLGGFDR